MPFLFSARHEASTENYATARSVHGFESYGGASYDYDQRKRHWSSSSYNQLPSKRRRSDAEMPIHQNPNMSAKIQQTSKKKAFDRVGGSSNQQRKAMEQHLKLHNPVGKKGKARRSKLRFTFYKPFSLDAKDKLKNQLDQVQASLVHSEHTTKAKVSPTLTKQISIKKGTR